MRRNRTRASGTTNGAKRVIVWLAILLLPAAIVVFTPGPAMIMDSFDYYSQGGQDNGIESQNAGARLVQVSPQVFMFRSPSIPSHTPGAVFLIQG